VALQVDLVSPEKILFSGEAEMVVCRAAGGDIAFLTGHVPFLGTLETGVVRIRPTSGDETLAAVREGFAHVHDDRVILLSDEAELSDDVKVDEARRQLQEAERRGDREDEEGEAEAARRWAEARIRASEG
jgi:F-type H+-transporting ATPase subunit epsilon